MPLFKRKDLKGRIINAIVRECNIMEPSGSIRIEHFGERGELRLYIRKDPQFNKDAEEDYNIVRLITKEYTDCGLKHVDDTRDVYVTDGSLHQELGRIWEHRDFATA